jgi:phosphohistidine phosphatase
MKQLILMRHAKSDWSQGGLTDFERPLNKRGVKDASNMGKWMAHHVGLPEVILCSTARRTQQTMQLLLLSLQSSDIETQDIAQLNFESMYLASTTTLNHLVQSHLNNHESIMLIAHNPGMEGLLTHYCPDAPLTHDSKLMTTGNMAVIEFDDLLNPALIAFQRPKDL